tara:strand:+ start:191 stop:325 length:135 start_codon:yes stop_codon:yes gene_type:complete
LEKVGKRLLTETIRSGMPEGDPERGVEPMDVRSPIQYACSEVNE